MASARLVVSLLSGGLLLKRLTIPVIFLQLHELHLNPKQHSEPEAGCEGRN